MALSKGKNQFNKHWSTTDQGRLEKLAQGNTPTRLIGHALGGSETAVRSKASELGIPLKPINQSPTTGERISPT